MGVSIGGSLGPIRVSKSIRMPKPPRQTKAQREQGPDAFGVLFVVGFTFIVTVLYLIVTYPIISGIALWHIVPRVRTGIANGKVKQEEYRIANEDFRLISRRLGRDLHSVTDAEVLDCLHRLSPNRLREVKNDWINIYNRHPYSRRMDELSDLAILVAKERNV